MVGWAPRESGDSRLVHDKLVEFYFVLDQPALRVLQSPIAPGDSSEALTPLSKWIVDFAKAWGGYLDESCARARKSATSSLEVLISLWCLSAPARSKWLARPSNIFCRARRLREAENLCKKVIQSSGLAAVDDKAGTGRGTSRPALSCSYSGCSPLYICVTSY